MCVWGGGGGEGVPRANVCIDGIARRTPHLPEAGQHPCDSLLPPSLHPFALTRVLHLSTGQVAKPPATLAAPSPSTGHRET